MRINGVICGKLKTPLKVNGNLKPDLGSLYACIFIKHVQFFPGKMDEPMKVEKGGPAPVVRDPEFQVNLALHL